jgi:type II secretion system protein N
MKLAVKLPSFSMTRGQTPAGGDRFRALLRRTRGVGAWIGIGFAFFVLFAWLSLPTRAIAWRISHEAKKAGYIIDVEDVSVTLFGNVVLENLTWTFEPSRPDQVPTKFLVEEVEIDVSFFSLLVGNVDIEVEARREEGRIFAAYERDTEESSFTLTVEDLPLYDVPKARQALGAPLYGLFALEVQLTMPENKFAKANGTIDITCAACKIGDGESKLYIPGSKGLKDGVTIPEIDLGTFVGKMEVEKGAAKTQGPMATTSEDIALSVEGSIKLKDPFPKSRLDMTVKFNITDAMQAKSEKLRLVIQGSDPKSKLDPPEKGLGYILTGALERPQFRGIKSKTARESRADKRARQQARDAQKRKSRDTRGDTKADPNVPAIPGTGEAGVGAGTPTPVPTEPGPNGLDVQPSTPPPSTTPPPATPPAVPTMPQPEPTEPTEPAPTEPSGEPPPAEPVPAEPVPTEPVEPSPEPAPPEDSGEQPSIVPEDGQLSGAPPEQ